MFRFHSFRQHKFLEHLALSWGHGAELQGLMGWWGRPTFPGIIENYTIPGQQVIHHYPLYVEIFQTLFWQNRDRITLSLLPRKHPWL